MQINIDSGKQNIYYQQDLFIPVTLKNIGVQALSISVPPMDTSVPIIKLTDLKDNISQVFRRSSVHGAIQHEATSLLPGEELKNGFNLLDIIPELDPGTYSLQVGWPFNKNANLVYSAPAPLNVLATSPRYLHTENAVGGHGDILFAVWTTHNASTGKNDIVRSRFSLTAGGGIQYVKKVADCRECEPLISAPAVGKVMGSQWIAWIEKGTLYYVHVDDELGVGKLHEQKLQDSKAEIVAPLYINEVLNTNVRPGGKLLLINESDDKKNFSLQAISFDEETYTGHEKTTINGKKPEWIKLHVNAKNEMDIYLLQSHGEKLRLKSTRVDLSGKDKNKVQVLNTWQAKLISANSIINANNEVYGGLLMAGKNDAGKNRLMLRRWQQKTNGVKSESSDVDWPVNRKIKSAHISIDDNGKLAAILRGTSRFWHVVAQNGELSPVPESFQQSSRALQLAFMEGNGELLLIAGTRQKGFEIVMQDGSPLPPSGTSK